MEKYYDWREDTWADAQAWAETGWAKAQLRKLKAALAALERELWGDEPQGILYAQALTWASEDVLGQGHTWSWCLDEAWAKGPHLVAARAAEYAARIRGWLLAARELPVPGGQVLSDLFSGAEGISPWHREDTFDVPVGYVSPGRLARWLWACYRRSQTILRPFRRKVDQRAAEALVGLAEGCRWRLPKVGRTAVRLAAASLPYTGVMIYDGSDPGEPWWQPAYLVGSYRQAREGLARMRGWRQSHLATATEEDVMVLRRAHALLRREGEKELTWAEAVAKARRMVLDDLGWAVDPEPCYSKLGVTVHRACTPSLYFGWVVKAQGQQPYHVDRAEAYQPRWAAEDAVRAWRRQAAERKASARAMARAFLDASIQATVRDSLAAGNCEPGTLAWMEKHGIKRPAVPVRDLFRWRRDPAVRRVIHTALRRAA